MLERLHSVRRLLRPIVDPNRPAVQWLLRQWVTWRLPRSRLSLAALRQRFTRPTYVFVAPDAGLAAHFSKVCIAAKALQDRGHSVLLLGCFEGFTRCTVMDTTAARLGTLEERRSACTMCGWTSLSYANRYGLPVLDIAELVEPESLGADLAAVPELLDFEYEGVPFGKISAGDLSRIFKLSRFRGLDPEMRAIMADYIETCVHSYRAMKALMQAIPVAGVTYFGDYGTLVGAATAAREAGLLAANLSIPPLHNMDHRRILVLGHHTETYRRKCIRVWPEWSTLALPAELVTELAQDSMYRLTTTGRTIYSPPIPRDQASLCRDIGFDPARKLVVAYTSSEDELVAVEQYMEAIGTPMHRGEQPFADQMEWLGALCDFAAKRDDLQLVIRVHPREAAGRDGKPTEHLQRLEQRFATLPSNVRVVWPAAKTSSYGIGEMADLVLTSWSSIGTEMARLGVPVIGSFSHVEQLPYGTVVDWVPTRDAYFALIDRRLADGGLDFDRVIQTNRWFNLYWLSYCVDVRDVVPDSAFAGLPDPKRPAQAELFERAIVGREDLIDVSKATLERAQTPSLVEAEADATRAGMRRLVRFLMTGDTSEGDYRLHFERVADPQAPATVPTGYDALVRSDGSTTVWIGGGTRHMRRSPMAGRLAEMATR